MKRFSENLRDIVIEFANELIEGIKVTAIILGAILAIVLFFIFFEMGQQMT